MSDRHLTEPALQPAGRCSLPWLLVLLVGSSGAALMDEIVWCQRVQLVIGSSALSLGVLLAGFYLLRVHDMAGASYSSLEFSRWFGRIDSPWSRL